VYDVVVGAAMLNCGVREVTVEIVVGRFKTSAEILDEVEGSTFTWRSPSSAI
jgi:hypothetical protein